MFQLITHSANIFRKDSSSPIQSESSESESANMEVEISVEDQEQDVSLSLHQCKENETMNKRALAVYGRGKKKNILDLHRLKLLEHMTNLKAVNPRSNASKNAHIEVMAYKMK